MQHVADALDLVAVALEQVVGELYVVLLESCHRLLQLEQLTLVGVDLQDSSRSLN